MASTKNPEGDNSLPDVDEEIGPPPIFSTWSKLYAFVLAVLVLEIVLFYLFTLAYA